MERHIVLPLVIALLTFSNVCTSEEPVVQPATVAPAIPEANVAKPNCDPLANPCKTDESSDLCKAYKMHCEVALATNNVTESSTSTVKPSKTGKRRPGRKHRKPNPSSKPPKSKSHKHKRRPKKQNTLKARMLRNDDDRKPKPSAGKPQKPPVKPQAPSGKPQKPAAKPQAPSGKPQKPNVAKPQKPANKPQKPVPKPQKPVPKPQKPVPKPQKPVLKPQKPSQKPQKPSGKPQKPGVKPLNDGKPQKPNNQQPANEQPNPAPARPLGCVGSAQACNCDCCPGLYCVEGPIPGTGRTCIKLETPPAECQKNPSANTVSNVNGGQQIQQGAGSIPVVGSGLQQGATTATNPSSPPNTASSGQSNQIPGVG